MDLVRNWSKYGGPALGMSTEIAHFEGTRNGGSSNLIMFDENSDSCIMIQIKIESS